MAPKAIPTEWWAWPTHSARGVSWSPVGASKGGAIGPFGTMEEAAAECDRQNNPSRLELSATTMQAENLRDAIIGPRTGGDVQNPPDDAGPAGTGAAE